MKTQLNEVMSLMGRMNLFEGTAKPRQQVGKNEIIDIIEKQDENGGGQWAAVTYVTVKPVYNTKKSWRKDDVDKAIADFSKEGNENWYDAVKSFNDDTEGKIKKLPMNKGIVVVRRYVLNWTTDASYAKAYGDYSEKLHNLRMSYGIGLDSNGMLGDNHNQREKTDYGAQINQTGNISKDFNFANVKSTKTTCYTIDDSGHITGEFPESMLKAMTAVSIAKPEKDVANTLSGEELEKYMAAKKELDAEFKGKNLLYDGMLSIVASVNGTNYYFINTAVKREIAKNAGVFVNSEELAQIAREQLSDSITNLDEFDSTK